jgi:hypothetical protein
MTRSVYLGAILFLLSGGVCSAEIVKNRPISEAQAKINIKRAESKIRSNCRKEVNRCHSEVAEIIYNSAIISDYKKILKYAGLYEPSTEFFGGKVRCSDLVYEIKKYKEYNTIAFWASVYAARKILNIETKDERKKVLDYAFACSVFRTQNGTIDLFITPNKEIPSTPDQFIAEARQTYGEKAAREYLDFREEIAEPYFVAYKKFLYGKKGRAWAEGMAKVVALTGNAHKAAKDGGYPALIVKYLDQLTFDSKIQVEQAVRVQ